MTGFPAARTNADSPLLQGLNPEQRAAVTFTGGNVLVLAGAGSGKTRVLTTRIAWLLQTGQVSSGGILAVTFTNKAAREMVTRLAAMVPVSVRGMWIGTFHGLCNRMLRAHAASVGLPRQFQILDMQDQLSALKRLLKAHNVDTELVPPKKLQSFINSCKEEGLRAGDVPVRDAESRQRVELYQLYEQQCMREGVVDFGELMLRSYELLRDNAAVRQHYQQRFRHVLVDEFQDTNRLQYLWLRLIAGEAGNGRLQGTSSVMAVGDDDQSIYAFRGARVGNMADFVREFGVAQPIKLEQNYRSYSHILDAANALIAHNSQRLGKTLRTEQGAGEPLRIYEAPSDFAEAGWIVDEVRQLMQVDGFARQEIAILYRSNAQSRVLESALISAKVPYRIYGGLRFFERAEIKHALAYLRLLENPQDDTSFLRVVNFPARGIGQRSIETLQDEAGRGGQSLHAASASLAGRAGDKLRGFVDLLDAMRREAQGKPLREIVSLVLEESGLLDHYRGEKDGVDRVENLEELVNAAEAFIAQEGYGADATALPLDEHGVPLVQSPASQGVDLDAPFIEESAGDAAALGAVLGERPGEPAFLVDAETGETLSPLGAFLTHASLEAGDNQAQAGQEAIQLMTVHASKGLEFDAVFIAGLEEGLFPHYNSMSDRDGLEEERRLMYVAITRARKRLYLSHAQERMLNGQSQYNPPSRFLEELPEESVRWLTPRRGAKGADGDAGLGAGPSSFWSSADGSSSPGRRSGAGGSSSWQGHQPRQSADERAWREAASAPVPARRQGAGDAHGIRAGQKVFHPKFGEGQVLALEGAGDDAKAKVNFGRHGTKLLLLTVAKLTVVD
ncbi:DNA helicase II [Corticibacter populi]|uniref:DNA 3'-5' helicase n=1 Tax=Corticibacter populi TaxID=1550736 RepID=A0A3M6QUG0_9BURK|nr:UvrD-helicase domain-containing protein [Corticibacter populi]RMX06667.1 DNA helicase II [Corticibacter populi]RZS31758.1 DNA helicase-2/ATP-dependent DNA helicase PcrA [Corticibacter populi]